MQEAVPAGVGAMAALLKLPEGKLDDVLQQAAQGEVVEDGRHCQGKRPRVRARVAVAGARRQLPDRVVGRRELARGRDQVTSLKLAGGSCSPFSCNSSR